MNDTGKGSTAGWAPFGQVGRTHEANQGGGLVQGTVRLQSAFEFEIVFLGASCKGWRRGVPI